MLLFKWFVFGILAAGVSGIFSGASTYGAIGPGHPQNLASCSELLGIDLEKPFQEQDPNKIASWEFLQRGATETYLNEVGQRSQVRKIIEQAQLYESADVPQFSREQKTITPPEPPEGSFLAFNEQFESDDKQKLAYCISVGGSDWRDLKIINNQTHVNESLGESYLIKFLGLAWHPDSQGFAYTGYRKPTGNKMVDTDPPSRLLFHKLGTPQAEDILLQEKSGWDYHPLEFIRGGTELLLQVTPPDQWAGNLVVLDLKTKETKTLVDFPKREFEFYGINKNFVFLLMRDVPNGHFVQIDLDHPEKENWKELIPESKTNALLSIRSFKNGYLAVYSDHALSKGLFFDSEGHYKGRLEIPFKGVLGGNFSIDPKNKNLYFSVENFVTPPKVYRYNFRSQKVSLVKESTVKFDPDQFVQKQVFYKSKDGTSVPMFISYKKGIKRDGSNPTYLYTYGGFDKLMAPFYYPSYVAWMQMGGILATPAVRGGGEYGALWHEAGSQLNKQNTIDDTISAALWLIDNKYTSTKHLALAGNSNGGLTTAITIIQRPDLFAAAVLQSPMIQLLKMKEITIGPGLVREYGDPDDKGVKKLMNRIDPLVQLKKEIKNGSKKDYPSTLVISERNDNRAPPIAAAYPFAAFLQATSSGKKGPILLLIQDGEGHDHSLVTELNLIEKESSRWTFLKSILTK